MSRVHEVHELLRAHGLRATHSRRVVLEVLEQASTPLTHADVVTILSDENQSVSDKATVYRNLMDFARVGLARRIDVGDHVWRFELTTSTSSAKGKHDATGCGGCAGCAGYAHPHFVCTDCGDVACLPQVHVELSSRLAANQAIANDEVEVHLRGLCDRCRGG